MNPTRRGFIFGGAATVLVAPVIVRAAASLMPISAPTVYPIYRTSYLSIRDITIEVIRLWNNSNAFIENIDSQYDECFRMAETKRPQNFIMRSA